MVKQQKNLYEAATLHKQLGETDYHAVAIENAGIVLRELADNTTPLQFYNYIRKLKAGDNKE